MERYEKNKYEFEVLYMIRGFKIDEVRRERVKCMIYFI